MPFAAQQGPAQFAYVNLRTAEMRHGLASVRHFYYGVRPGECRFGNTAAALFGTPPRRHKRNRAESKARARWMGLCRFFGQPLIGGEYQLGL